jgi:hypothetical protein
MANTVHVKVSFVGSLTLIFIVLKLIGVIAWSWWWVLAPTWIPFAIVAVLALFALGVGAMVG